MSRYQAQFTKPRGTPAQAIEKAMGQDIIASCAEIEQEIQRVLIEKFLWEQSRTQAALDRILSPAVRVELHHTVKLCRDPKDDMFLECAQRAHAHLLVAGDKDLLVLESFKRTGL